MAGASDEEKALELEALLAIYGNDFRVVADDTGTEVTYELDLTGIDAVLSFRLPDKYPEVSPAIHVQWNDKNIPELEETLNTTAQDQLGEVMIHNVIEEAKQWAWSHKYEFTNEQQANKATEAKDDNVCKFFLQGKCKFADKCFNKHDVTSKEAMASCDESLHHAIDQEIENPKKNLKSKHSVTNEDDSNAKKKSMKTATDVISRIQWDRQLNKADFHIGYLDRFVGIVEQPFSEFSWENLASVDYHVLAIPKHRIQYFKYRGRIVWDKRERIDDVFGSTGGKTILDVMTTIQEAPPEGKPDENEVDEIFEMEVVPGKPKSGGKSVKTGPNFFIAFKIKDPGILDKVKELQRGVIEKEPLLADGFIPPQQLHITLLMLTLNNDSQISQAQAILKGLQHVFTSILPPTHELHFKEVGFFRDRILYVNTTLNNELQSVVKILRYKFQNAGINLDGNRSEFHPHLTVLRVPNSSISQVRSREVFSAFKITYRDVSFGSQGLDSVSLYSRFGPKELDGTHQRVLTLENSLLPVSPTLPTKILNHVQRLHEHGKFDDKVKGEIEGIIEEKTAISLEHVLAKLTSTASQGNSKRLLVIMRGIPGCGKSFLLDHCTESKEPGKLAVCSTKQLFYREGNSRVDETELNIAEGYCRMQFLESLASPTLIIAIDDCHMHTWEYAFYKKIAPAFGVTCHVLEITCADSESIRRCSNYVTSGVEELLEIVENWEPEPEAVRVEPWFRNPALQETSGFSLRDLLSQA